MTDTLVITLRDLFREGPEFEPDVARDFAHARAAAVGEDDPQTLVAPPASARDLVPEALRISYQDRHGEISHRTVTVKKVWDSEGEIYLRARCHLRNAWRTFLGDGILEMVDPATGQVFEPPGAYLRRMAGPPEKSAEVVAWLRAPLTVLVYMARAHGRFSAAERDAILAYVAPRQRGLPVEPGALRDRIGRIYPDRDDVEQAMPQIARMEPPELAALYGAAVTVMMADGHAAPEEEAFLAGWRDGLLRAGLPAEMLPTR